MSRKRLYGIWYTMKTRCYKEKCINYKNYGGRGITVCNEWQSDFENFYNWALENGYVEGLSIDRIDNNKGYSPENCRWATRIEQANNQRSNHLITYNGKTQTLKQWADELKIPYTSLKSRINNYNFPIEKAFEKTNFKQLRITYNNKTQNLKEWCNELGVKYSTVKSRIQRGWGPIKALETPTKNK